MSKLFSKKKGARKASKKKQNLQLEALENRILLSADLGISASDMQQPQPGEVIESELQLETLEGSEFEPQTIAVDDSLTRLADELIVAEGDALASDDAATDAASEQAPATDDAETQKQALSPEALYLAQQVQAQEIIIVDAGIPQLESVLNELFNSTDVAVVDTLNTLNSLESATVQQATPAADTADQSEIAAEELIGLSVEDQIRFNAEREVKIFVLNSEQDGIAQVSSILDYFDNVAAVHLLSHGSAGALFLGNSQLNSQQLRQNAQQIKRWGNALTADGDLLLYGCDVAAGAEGEGFIEQLADLTGADVAASDDDTGNGAQADWDLERRAGAVETAVLSSAAMQGVLATTPTDGNDTLTVTANTAGLKGDDVYKFTALPTSKVTVTENKGEGSDTLDLSGISEATDHHH